MKILFVVPHDRAAYDGRTVREQPSGGTERATIFLGEALTELGHEVRWVTSRDECEHMDTRWPDAVVTPLAELFQRFPDAPWPARLNSISSCDRASFRNRSSLPQQHQLLWLQRGTYQGQYQ